MEGELQAIHCDFFKMDPRHQEIIKPEYSSQVIFQDLGIKAVPWTAGNFCHSLKLILYKQLFLYQCGSFVYWMYMQYKERFRMFR